MLTKLRNKIQVWVELATQVTQRTGLKPNQVSVLGVFLAIASGTSFWTSGLIQNQEVFDVSLILLGGFLLILSGLCDILDGSLARLSGTTTLFGGFFDSLLDRYADAAIYSGLILGGLCSPFWGFVALVGSLLTSYTRARAEATGVEMETIGIAERAERLLIIAGASFMNLVWQGSIYWSIVILAFLTNITVIQRVNYVHHRLSKTI